MGLAGARRIVSEGGSVIVTGINPSRISEAQRTLGDGGQVLANDAADPASPQRWRKQPELPVDWTGYGSTRGMRR